MKNENEINFGELEIDKENSTVSYNDKLHKYWTKDTKQSCISVTTLIHNFTSFNETFWSNYKAVQRLLGEDYFDGPIIGKQKVKGVTKDKRGPASELKKLLLDTKVFKEDFLIGHNITKEQVEEERQIILSEWAEKRDASCIRGTAIHREQEMRLLAGKCTELSYFDLGGKFESNSSNNLKPGEQNVYPELLLSRISPDGELRIAGQADLIIIDGFDVYVLDFKTNESIDKESYYDPKKRKKQMLKYPLNNIQDTNFWHYTLQLSTYAWMIKKLDSRYNIKKLILIHFDHNGGVTNYECEYLEKDVERMLAYHKKQMEYENFKKSREKIIF